MTGNTDKDVLITRRAFQEADPEHDHIRVEKKLFWWTYGHVNKSSQIQNEHERDQTGNFPELMKHYAFCLVFHHG